MIEAFARVAEGKAKWTDELVLTKDKKVGDAGILPDFADGCYPQISQIPQIYRKKTTPDQAPNKNKVPGCPLEI